ncbi:MAG: hypothetical protein FWG50_11560, partial [Kiritimatiellaeota bacterium]|nr:hypothetical protein [Kiritimatiellota bacterium]
KGGRPQKPNLKSELKSKQKSKRKQPEPYRDIYSSLRSESISPPESSYELSAPQRAKSPTTKKFTPPTAEEVRAYCAERNNGIDANDFIDHYAARGWHYNGNLAMKDWRAAVRTWEKRNFPRTPAVGSPPISRVLKSAVQTAVILEQREKERENNESIRV